MADSTGEPATNKTSGPTNDEGLLASLEGERGRRLVHFSGTGVPLTYLLTVEFGFRWLGIGLFVVGLTLAVWMEVARLHFKVRWWAFEHLTRPYEEEKVAGYALYAVSMTTVAFVFEPDIAVAAMLMLSIGDPVSGHLSADERVKGPRVTVPTFLVCLLLGLPFLSPIVAAAAATAATVSDAVLVSVRGYVLDDNLTIPIAAACTAWLVRELPSLLSAAGLA
jgi:dolichol kinase